PIRFGPVHRGVGGRIHDEARTQLAHRAPQGPGILEVKGAPVRGMHFAEGSEKRRQAGADLTVPPGQEHDHRNVSARESSAPAASRAERIGWASEGHTIPTSLSFQASVRSLPGSRKAVSL